MRKLLPYTFIILFPYAIGFLLCALLHPSWMKDLFQNNIYPGLFFLCLFWLFALLSAVTACIYHLACRRDAAELARINLLIKLIQIPAYLFIFAAGLVCMLTIFTIGISFVLMILDGASILLSGFVGISAVKRSHAQGMISTAEMVLHGILQFVFCADIFSAILLFRKTKQ